MRGIIISVQSGCSAGGSAPDWGSGGRKFKSCHSDHNKSICFGRCSFFIYLFKLIFFISEVKLYENRL